ncbi:MAG: dephospho-CoA kinase [Pseudomonadota bacterium]
MKRIGLTGSIGMGKTETGKMFERHGVPVFDADAAVHALYAEGGKAVGPVGARFPEAIVGGAVDRTRLGPLVLGNPEALKALETIVHPLVGEARAAFMAEAETAGRAAVVLDVPLLFEGGGEAHMDATVVVTAPADVQKERVLARPNMSPEKFAAILESQIPDAEKRKRADFIVETHLGFEAAERQVVAILDALGLRTASAAD